MVAPVRNRVGRDVWFCEGFRMPAAHERAASAGGRRSKTSKGRNRGMHANCHTLGPGPVGFGRYSLLAIFQFPFRRAGDRFDMWQRLVREGDWIPFGRGHDQADDQREDEGPAHEAYTLYSSHTVWQSKATFEAWTKSEAFRLAHRDARPRPRLSSSARRSGRKLRSGGR